MWGFPLREILSPDKRWFLHRRDHDLWLRQPGSDKLVRLTDDGIERFDWGEAFEWDGNYGRPWAWWSPDGSKVAVRKVDLRPVPTVPVVTYVEGRPKVDRLSFSKPGEPLPLRELFLIDVFEGQRIRVDDDGDPEQHILALEWRPDGDEFFYVTLNRAHKRLRLLAANASTGHAREVIVEERDTFHDPLWSSPPQYVPLGDSDHFLWTSDRDGWRHVYLYSRSGRLERQLTEGSFPVHEIVAVDEVEGWVYFTAHPDQNRPYDIHLARVGVDGNGYRQLTSAPGHHRIRMAPSHRFFVDTHSSVDRPQVTEVRHADGTLVDTLSRSDIRPLERVGWVPPEEVVVTAVDGETRLHGVLYKPFDFDPEKRYPIVEYIYDGWNTTVVSRTFSRPGNAGDDYPLDSIDPLALAQLGFVVWVVDGRGTDERGKAFLDVVYGGQFDSIPDHVSALQQVAASRPYMDLGRVGIFGISGGGSQTLQALLKAPETYHVGVAIAPGIDPKDLRASGPEVIRGFIQDNPEAYEAELIERADQLEGRLMLMHGTNDPVIPLSHTLRMVNALVDAGRPHDLVVIPGGHHGFQGKRAHYAREAIKRYFVQHLNPR